MSNDQRDESKAKGASRARKGGPEAPTRARATGAEPGDELDDDMFDDDEDGDAAPDAADGEDGEERAYLADDEDAPGEDDVDADDDEDDDEDGEDDDGDAAETANGEPPELSRKVRRRRRTRPRSKTIAMKRLTREELRVGALMYPPVDEPRPESRSECRGEARPCPWVACKHHLYLDVNPETGSIKINFPDLEPWEMRETCALDVAERGGITLEEVGEIMNLTRERIRQVEVRGLLKLKMASPSPEELGAELLKADDDLD
jgi:hypothetical protein